MAQPILENMEAVRLRGIRAQPDAQIHTLAVMDSCDRNKVLMLVPVLINMHDGLALVLDIYGERLFYVSQISTPFFTVTAENIMVGRTNIVDVPNEQMEQVSLELANDDRRFTVELSTDINLHLSDLKTDAYKIVDEDNITQCEVDRCVCATVVEVRMNRQLLVEEKMLMLAWAIKASLYIYEIHEMSVPEIADVTGPSQNPQVYELLVPEDETAQYQPLVSLTAGMRIRAAGYLGTMIFYDVIDIATNKVAFSIEYKPTYHAETTVRGDNTAADSIAHVEGYAAVKGCDSTGICFLYGITNDEPLYIYSPNREMLAYYADEKFWTPERKKITIHILQTTQPDAIVPNKTMQTIQVYDNEYNILAELYPLNCAVETEIIEENISSMERVLILATAVRACSRTYGFDKLPMPCIEYNYL